MNWTNESKREKKETKDDTLVHIQHTWKQYGILFLYLNEEEEEDAIHVPIFKKKQLVCGVMCDMGCCFWFSICLSVYFCSSIFIFAFAYILFTCCVSMRIAQYFFICLSLCHRNTHKQTNWWRLEREHSIKSNIIILE